MTNLRVTEIKAFVPSKDFEVSKQFYKDLGFTMASEGGGDAEMIRQLHIKHLRASIPVQDLVPVLKFLHSENGKHWYPAERTLMRRLSAELTKIRLEVEAVESKTYGEEQARIYQTFVVETKARAKNPPATGVH